VWIAKISSAVDYRFTILQVHIENKKYQETI